MNAALTTTLMQADGIRQRIPHAGRMSLLDALHAWDDERVLCSSRTHLADDHPLRSASGLLAPVAIEYAAQAMALHGALQAERDNPGAQPTPGFLASVRGVKLHVARLDTLPGALQIEARRHAAQGEHVLYDFVLRCEATPVAEGRAAVVLNTPFKRPT